PKFTGLLSFLPATKRGETVTQVCAESAAALVGERLSVSALQQLCGTLGGYSFVKVVHDRETGLVHFLNDARHSVHAIYIVREIPGSELPRVFAHELFSTAPFVALNPGKARGRVRVFTTETDYRSAALEWSDIIVMDRVPDDIPRLSGIVNARHTTPLSHT